ncbi:hypothetical protein CBM2637_B110517 [Cupriavidus taiwanensis]|uniref:hypothetical protein n=1 Tax=Cupriavidus taiwanensis TaxID=164546 RepID=UPI000E1944D9|nr:hypothetical protein [Cupriavidus taiwanensis]SPA31340.1 hypothetical protein CBM2637_B110517 [Cupriavidus taiwanensis]
MASIDDISLDGFGSENKYKSAIALHLTTESTVSKVEHLDDWEFEVRRGSGFLVARNKKPLGREDTLREGYEQAERFLDILSFENASTIEIGAPGRSHILLFERDGKSVIERMATADNPMSIQVTITQTGPDGQIVPQPPSPAAKWISALRFYRLSQTSRSPHEAYRNLWLGLEVLLSTEIPKGPKEKEGIWLRRALNQITSTLDLSHEAPSGVNIVDYVMERHYTAMRCNLFHAKIVTTSAAPSMPTVEEALDAYAELIRIWRAIAVRIGALRFTGSGLITYAGYAMQMAGLFSQVIFHATEDNALPAATDKTVSPNNCPIVAFDASSHIGVVAPGKVENLGIIDLSAREALSPFRRITTSVAAILYSVDYLTGGLNVNGVDFFEYRQGWRLVNTGMPRTYFD